mgnify:FL=1
MFRILLLCALALSGCGGGGSGAGASSGFTVVSTEPGTVVNANLNSSQTGIGYDLYIWLPASYSKSALSYPVVYATDCEYRFSTLKQVMEQRNAQALLVNVCAMGSERRWVDFTMPGAEAYYQFLIRELVPYIEAHYRVGGQQRVLSGHSLSAEFVLYAMYLEDPAHRYFSSIISADCSCWYDGSKHFSQDLSTPLLMEQAMEAANSHLPVKLVMAGDTTANERNVQPVYARLLARNIPDLKMLHLAYNLGHVGMDGPSFNDALDFVWPK